MKLPMPTAQEVYEMANRAAGQLGSNRGTNTLLIENAIRNALQLIVDRLDIQIPQPIGLNLSKPQ